MAAWNAAGFVATAAYGFVVTRLIVEHTGEHAFGIWATVGAIRGFILFLDGGLSFGIQRDAALAASPGGENASRIRATRRIYGGLAVAALVAFAVAAGFPALLLGLEGADAETARDVTLLLGAETAAALLASPLAAILRGRQRFDVLAISAWSQAILGAAILAVLAPRHGLAGAAIAALASRAVVLAGMWSWLRVKAFLPRGPVVPGTPRAVIAFAAPLWLAAVGTQIGAGTDIPVVGGFYGAEAAGHYALGALLPGIAAGLLFTVMGASFPRMVAATDAERPRMAGTLIFMASVLAAFGFTFLAFHEESLLRVWVGRAPPLAVAVGMIASLSWMLNAPAHVLSSLAIARGEHAVVGPVVLAEALVNVALSIALAAWWAPLGPAVATLLLIAVSNLVVVPAVLRQRLGLRWVSILRPAACGFGIGLFGGSAIWELTTAAGLGPPATVALGGILSVVAAACVLDLTVSGESKLRRGIVLARRGGFKVLRRQKAEAAAERIRLAELRRTSPIVWTKSAPPLVTVRIATYNRGQLVADRAVASALAQTHENVEVLVVGDHCDDVTANAVLAVRDRRVRFVNLAERGRYPEDAMMRWMVAGAAPMNHALDIARGEWIAPLDDDDEFTPDHVEALLDECRSRSLEFVYGVAEMEQSDGTWTRCGSWPVRPGQIVHAAVMWSSRIKLRHDVESWKLDEPGDWNLWHRMRDAGVPMGFVDHVVCRHHRERREVRVVQPFWSGDR